MPNITAAGTKTAEDAGFGFLNATNDITTLLFAGSTLPTTLEIKYTDDEGVDHVLEDGTITALPTSIIVEGVRRPLKIVSTGGSPNFNVIGS